MRRYSNNWFKAIAAYNAGEAAVDRWEKDIVTDDIEEFVERIPYLETRQYVKLVLRNHRIYKTFIHPGSMSQARDEPPSGNRHHRRFLGTANKPGPEPTEKGLYSLASRYCDAIENAGGLPIIIPHSRSRTQIRHLLRRIDGLLISGGGFDIDPADHGEQPIGKLGKINSQRTFTELESIAFGLDRDLPMLGICGGAQAINVALGGSLYQDIATQLPAAQKASAGGARSDKDTAM